jgi:hypothetical protein
MKDVCNVPAEEISQEKLLSPSHKQSAFESASAASK